MWFFLIVLALSYVQVSVLAQNASYLTASALVTNAQNHSALECWKLTTSLTTSSTAGTSGSSGFMFDATDAEYTIIPPRFDGGTHNAPTPQLVAFTSGLIHISLPYAVTGNASQDEAWIIGGTSGLLIAVDTTGEGHDTTYPSDQPTFALQIPFEGGLIPSHEVLFSGPCHYDSVVGLVTTG